jgi:hypothetical protein
MTNWVLALAPSKFAAAPGFSVIAIFEIELNLYRLVLPRAPWYCNGQSGRQLYRKSLWGMRIVGDFKLPRQSCPAIAHLTDP